MATKIFLNNDWQDYDYDTLYSTLGYTKIKCEVYAKEGDYVWSWYNPVMREYWDDREWKKLWTPIPPKPLDEIPFLVFDNGLGRIVHTTEEDILSYSDIPPHVISDSLMSYSDISVTTISDTTMITTLELGVAVRSFFFTNKGNKETENSERRGSVNDFIYDETGHLIVGEDIDVGYDHAPVLSLTQVDGNMLSPINGDYIYMSSTRRNWYFHPERGTRFVWSLQVERINPTPSELTAYFTSAGAAGTSDTRIGGSFGNTPATLYDASGNPLPYDLSKKYTILGMYNYSGGSVEVLSYSILKDTNGIVQYIPGGIKNVFTIVLSLSEQTTIDAYFTSAGASATTDTTCQSTLTYTLYDANGNFIPYDSTKTYTTVASFVVNGNTAYADFTGNYASWSDAILKGRPSGTNTYYKIIIRIE